MLFESAVLILMGGVQAYIVRRLDKQDKMISQLRDEVRQSIRRAPKRSTDP